MRHDHKGRYNMDYSPKYQNPYDIYDKAKGHMKRVRRQRAEAERQQQKPAIPEQEWDRAGL